MLPSNVCIVTRRGEDDTRLAGRRVEFPRTDWIATARQSIASESRRTTGCCLLPPVRTENRCIYIWEFGRRNPETGLEIPGLSLRSFAAEVVRDAVEMVEPVYPAR